MLCVAVQFREKKRRKYLFLSSIYIVKEITLLFGPVNMGLEKKRKKSIPQHSSIDVVWISTLNHKTGYSTPTNYQIRSIYTPQQFLRWVSPMWRQVD
jgi:hypothetical protein